MRNLSVHSLCSADGHDVDPVDLFGLVLQARLDAAYQRLDLGTAQAIIDVDPGGSPYPARADEGDEELADGGHAGYPRTKARILSSSAGRSGWVTPRTSRPCGPPAAPVQAPTRKSWLREMSRRLRRMSTSAMSTAATP